MIRILGLATASPPFELNQKDALKFVLQNRNLRPGAKALYEKVLSDPGIERRRFALNELSDVLEEDPDKISRRFEKESVALSARALEGALENARTDPRSLDFLAVSTCTGYLCPGISSRLLEACGLRSDVRCLDVVGMGCGSAIPALEAAHNFAAANPGARAAALSTEICSAAIFWEDEPDLIVSNSIFGDGSAAVILSGSGSPGTASIRRFGSLTQPEWRETLRFRTQGGRLRNVLHKDVPSIAAACLKSLIGKTLREAEKNPGQVDHWLFHSGGTKVLDAVALSLGLPDEKMRISRGVLRNHGNLSSPTVLYALKELLDSKPKSGQTVLLSSFGAGFTAHVCLLETE